MLDYRQINCILLVLKMIFPFNSPEPKFYCIVQGANGRVTVNLQPPTVNNDDEDDEGQDEDNTSAENDIAFFIYIYENLTHFPVQNLPDFLKSMHFLQKICIFLPKTCNFFPKTCNFFSNICIFLFMS